jgi:hypothetical protein
MLRRIVGTVTLVACASLFLHGCSGDSKTPVQPIPADKSKVDTPSKPPSLPKGGPPKTPNS